VIRETAALRDKWRLCSFPFSCLGTGKGKGKGRQLWLLVPDLDASPRHPSLLPTLTHDAFPSGFTVEIETESGAVRGLELRQPSFQAVNCEPQDTHYRQYA
jgi:hypothetical protein